MLAGRLQTPLPFPLINPPISHDTPLGSLSGYRLVLGCPKCGPKEKDVDKLITSVRIYATKLSVILPKLECSTCKSRPTRLEAECVWIKAYDRSWPKIDLTWLLAPQPTAAPVQASLLDGLL